MKVLTYKRSRGFSLVEVLLGMTVLSIALLALFATFLIVTSGILNTKGHEEVAMRILSELERVEGAENLVTGTTSKTVNGIKLTTETTGSSTGTRYVTVTASWTSATGKLKTLTMNRTMNRTKSKYADLNAGETDGGGY